MSENARLAEARARLRKARADIALHSDADVRKVVTLLCDANLTALDRIDQLRADLKRAMEALESMTGYVKSDYEGSGGKDLTGGEWTKARALLTVLKEKYPE